jgi:hypothetical protein
VAWYLPTSHVDGGDGVCCMRAPEKLKKPTMGGCGSKVTEDEKASRALQAVHEAEFNEDKRKIKLLLLGAAVLWW